MEGNVDGNTAIECDGGEVLVEEGLKEDDLIPVLQKCDENRVLAWGGRNRVSETEVGLIEWNKGG